MTDAALFGIANSVLQQLASPEFVEFRLRWSHKAQFEELEDIVTTIRNALEDAYCKQATDATVRGWLARVGVVLYEADDLFDAISAQVLLKKNRKGTEIGEKVRHLISDTNLYVTFQLKYARKVKEIRGRFDDIARDIKGFYFLPNQPNIDPTSSRIRRKKTYFYVPGHEVIGREQEKEDIVRMLLPGCSEEQSIIAVIGIGGSGKTTLAQLVYNDVRIQQGFDLCMWACINYFSDLKQVLITLLKSATMSEPKNLDLDKLQTLFRDEIEGKRFLLVLDDVWDEDSQNWGNLKDLLSSGKEGSKVLTTTHSNHVVWCSRATEPYFFLGPGLSDESAWLLFRKIAFENEEDGENLELGQLGRLIVKKCVNVPLVIVTIASLLREKEKEMWPLVNDELSKVFNEDYDEKIIHILEISYKELPYPVKRCYGYCSLFPKDFEFERDSLVHLWIAQGFIEPFSDQRLEGTAKEYFFCLLDRCFFQPTTIDEGKKSIVTYQMHYLMHDLAKKVTESETILVDNTDQRSWDETIRHVSINCHWNWKSMVHHVCSFSHSKSLRTFIHPCRDFYNGDALEKLMPSFKSLRVLRFLGIQDVPTSMGELIHLRFLDLSENSMRRLPSSICSLPQLQSLILRSCVMEDLEFPEEMEDMLSLRHLDLSENKAIRLPRSICRLPHLESLILRGWTALKKLPEDFGDLQTLRLLDLSGNYSLVGLPRSICKLHHLESLILQGCRNLKEFPDEMGHLRSLRHLVITGCNIRLKISPGFIALRSRLTRRLNTGSLQIELSSTRCESVITDAETSSPLQDISSNIYGCIENISRGIDTYIETEDQFFDTDTNESKSIEEVKGYFLDTNIIQDVMTKIDKLDSYMIKSHLSPKSRSRKRKRDFGIATEQSLGQFKTVTKEATSSSNVTTPTISDDFIFDLRRKMRIFTNRAFYLGLMDIQKEHHYISVVEDVLELLCNEHPLFKEELRSSMMGAEETKEEPRYLLVSSGCAVCILDLNQSKAKTTGGNEVKQKSKEEQADDQVLALPKMAILNLIEKQLPVSVGLFKSGSYAYITGGHEFSRQEEDSENSSSDCKLYKHLWVKGCFEGTSCATYRLDVKEEDGKMTLVPSKCDYMVLQSPKFWPIVEQIGKELHVFDSAPSNIQANVDESWIFSHEILGYDPVSTTAVPSEQGFIYSHVVVGHRFYAVAGEKNLMYENNEWQVHDRVYDWMRSGDAAEAKTVWDILECGNASCIGKAEPNSEELYVIIAVVRNDLAGIHIDDDSVFPQTTDSYAYLMTLEGKVVCIQSLHHLFLKTKLEPYNMVQGSVIKASTDQWAAIVIGKAFADETRVDNKDYLFIYMFTVKDCIRAISDTFRKRADEYLKATKCVMVADFVRVDVKARYIYETNADFDNDDDFACLVGLRACFLDSL